MITRNSNNNNNDNIQQDMNSTRHIKTCLPCTKQMHHYSPLITTRAYSFTKMNSSDLSVFQGLFTNYKKIVTNC